MKSSESIHDTPCCTDVCNYKQEVATLLIQPIPLPRWHRRDVDLFTPTTLGSRVNATPVENSIITATIYTPYSPSPSAQKWSFPIPFLRYSSCENRSPPILIFLRSTKLCRKNTFLQIEFFKNILHLYIYIYIHITLMHHEINNIYHLLDF